MSKNKLQKTKEYKLPVNLPVSQSIGSLFHILDEKDSKIVQQLSNELIDTYEKAHMYRSDTEARISILNDIEYPTPAAKYWQCVREQNSHFEEAINESYRIKWCKIEVLKAEKAIKEGIEEGDEIKRLEGELEKDGKTIEIGNLTRSLKWRIYELQMWSDIKAELDDGSFDTTHVNSHMSETYQLYWADRVKALHKDSPSGEIINALGSYISSQKVVGENNKIIPFSEIDPVLNLNKPPTNKLINDLSESLNKKIEAQNEGKPIISNDVPPMVIERLEEVTLKQLHDKNTKKTPPKNNSWY